MDGNATIMVSCMCSDHIGSVSRLVDKLLGVFHLLVTAEARNWPLGSAADRN
jgi:hypothetical protein